MGDSDRWALRPWLPWIDQWTVLSVGAVAALYFLLEHHIDSCRLTSFGVEPLAVALSLLFELLEIDLSNVIAWLHDFICVILLKGPVLHVFPLFPIEIINW